MNAQPLTTRSSEEPSVAGLRVRPFWPVVLYLLLAGSALLALWAQRSGAAPDEVTVIAPWVFLAFAVGFSIYRLSLVAVRRYSAFKALSQILVAALFFMLLLLPRVGSQAVAPVDPAAALADRDPRVRALAAEVLGWRQATSAGSALVRLLSDDHPTVRTAAHQALVRLNGGVDLGGASETLPIDDQAVGRWKARFP
jgi:hypothetical protein